METDLTPDAWRYRFQQKEGWGKWFVQKNKPSWWCSDQPDVQLEPLYSSVTFDAIIEMCAKSVEDQIDSKPNWTDSDIERLNTYSATMAARAAARVAIRQSAETIRSLTYNKAGRYNR